MLDATKDQGKIDNHACCSLNSASPSWLAEISDSSLWAVPGTRPPWTAEVQKLQEQIFADSATTLATACSSIYGSVASADSS